jgi:hypothetical protein
LEIKEQANKIITSYKKDIEMLEEKLGFKTEIEFQKVRSNHEQEQPELREKNRNQRQQINRERDTLKNAESALKNGVV